jgi:hypothetical protein
VPSSLTSQGMPIGGDEHEEDVEGTRDTAKGLHWRIRLAGATTSDDLTA